MPSKSFEPYEIVAVPFPFTDKMTTKLRPAVVLSSKAFNEDTQKIIAAMITTSKAFLWKTDTKVTDLKSAGIGLPCLIRMKLFTIDQNFVLKKLGKLGDRDKARLIENVEATIW